jgi:hypothetical protein
MIIYKLCKNYLMNNKAIPTLLIATIMIAGAFAFMPVQEASTVHTTSGNSAIQELVSEITGSTADEDILLTCPATSSGCHILEVFVQNTVAQDVVFDTINGNINGVAVAGIVNPADLTVSNAVALMPEIGGFSMGPGDTLEFQTVDGTTHADSRYSLRVIAEVGNGIAMTAVGQA